MHWLPNNIWRTILVVLPLLVALQGAVVPGSTAGTSAANNKDTSLAPLADTTRASVDGTKSLLQFTSAGHILGFDSNAVYLASSDHSLRMEFTGSLPVQPVATSGSAICNGAPTLRKVAYNGIWKNIDAVFSATDDGIAMSTYIVHPGGDPGDISLRYNTTVQLTPEGTLRLAFNTGYMTASPPIAWQEINGTRLPVLVAFCQQAANQIGFVVGNYDRDHTLYIDPTYRWHTFYGSDNNDYGRDIAVDSSGNVYIVGYSTKGWNGPEGQNPLHSHSGGTDIVVIKLDSNGNYQWHTFYGSDGYDYGRDIAVDSSNNLYVVGSSSAVWNGPSGEPPRRNYQGGLDITVIKLSSTGAYQWHTFYGSTSAFEEDGKGIAVDSQANVYVVGYSPTSWTGPMGKQPLNSYKDGSDIVVIKLDSNATYQWHTLYGSYDDDVGKGIAVDSSVNVYVVGASENGWLGPGNAPPKNSYTGNIDIAVIKLNSAGAYQWHTFYGSDGYDYGRDIAVDSLDGIYVVGDSSKPWNGPAGWPPLNGYSGGYDFVAVKLNSVGDYQWHTFHGSAGNNEQGYGIAVDPSGSVYIVGTSFATWGTPLHGYSGIGDITAIKLADDVPQLVGTYATGCSIKLFDWQCNKLTPVSAGTLYITKQSGHKVMGYWQPDVVPDGWPSLVPASGYVGPFHRDDKGKVKNTPRLSLILEVGTHGGYPFQTYVTYVLNGKVKWDKKLNTVKSIKGIISGWGEYSTRLENGSPSQGQFEGKYTAAQ